jgi:hypothetical protein
MKPGPWILLTLLAVLHLARAVASENSIAFLGPKGSYSDQAASDYASRAELSGTTPLGTMAQIAQSVRDGRVQYGLLPFENSIGGFVGETHRLLLATQDPGWHVIAEVTLSISNNLLVKPGTRPSDLRRIISHPEALRESTNWLKANFPQLPQEGVNSTAAAAEAVAKGDGTIAAIASAAAANVYQLRYYSRTSRTINAMPRRFSLRKPRDEISWNSIPLVSLLGLIHRKTMLVSVKDKRCRASTTRVRASSTARPLARSAHTDSRSYSTPNPTRISNRSNLRFVRPAPR